MSLRRIARLAGVSLTTVSLALRNSPKISPETRRRVLKHAHAVGYRANARVAELMSQVRRNRDAPPEACLGVISFYDNPRPWEDALHLRGIHEGMTARADTLGYRLEPFWMRAPGMTPRRLRGILEARGIEGLLCFGSPQLDEKMPPELDRYAIVTQGVSIRTSLHRVLSHAYNNMWHVLKKVQQLGYRRPGLMIGDYEGERNAHAYLCVYLGWCHLVLGTPPPIPVLNQKHVEEGPLVEWIGRHQPDVIILAHHYNALADFQQVLRRHRIRVPEDLGVAVITQVLTGTDFSGLQGNPPLLGEWMVELLVARIMNRDFGLPSHPRIEMIEMDWVDGQSLRPPCP